MTGVTRAGRRLFYPALISIGIGMLASCAEILPPPAPRTVAALRPRTLPFAPTPRRRTAFPVPKRKPAPPARNDAAAADTPAAVAMAAPGTSEPEAPAAGPVAPAPEPAPAPQASALVGLDEPAAAHLLGTATEQSTQPPATVWRYRNATCELDLFFYLDLRSGKMRALHYKFKGDPANPDGQRDCLRSLVVVRRSQSQF